MYPGGGVPGPGLSPYIYYGLQCRIRDSRHGRMHPGGGDLVKASRNAIIGRRNTWKRRKAYLASSVRGSGICGQECIRGGGGNLVEASRNTLILPEFVFCMFHEGVRKWGLGLIRARPSISPPSKACRNPPSRAEKGLAPLRGSRLALIWPRPISPRKRGSGPDEA